jgi:tol-pal system protein YbgF
MPGLRPAGAAPGGAALGAALLFAAGLLTALPGCVPPQLLTVRSGLDSLRTVVDSMVVRDSIAYQVLLDTRRELAEQRELVLSTRATAGTTTQQVSDEMERLDARLQEVMGRFELVRQHVAPPAAPAGPDPNQLYDQAALDLTQGRYGLALDGFREYVRRFPATELADNAQYGVGECFFAQTQFDSAAVEYARVEAQWPQADKVPAALYKEALCQEKLGQDAAAKKGLEDLIKRFPLAGESQLARERLAMRGRH